MDKFCSLGDMLGVGGGAGTAVESVVQVGWSKFKWLVPFFAGRDMSLTVRGRSREL